MFKWSISQACNLCTANLESSNLAKPQIENRINWRLWKHALNKCIKKNSSIINPPLPPTVTSFILWNLYPLSWLQFFSDLGIRSKWNNGNYYKKSYHLHKVFIIICQNSQTSRPHGTAVPSFQNQIIVSSTRCFK